MTDHMTNNNTQPIGIIGGTGITELVAQQGLRLGDKQTVSTPLGEPSGELQWASWHDQSVVFLPRHGHPHKVPPHLINYRANMLALHHAGVSAIIAINVVGGIHPDMMSGAIVVPNQVIDYTWGRDSTFFDGQYQPLDHIEFSDPYDERIRQTLIKGAAKAHVEVCDHGVYGATQGPRLETRAEIKRMQNDGCDLVGMTGMPEAALARELKIPYASVCLVVNPAAGKTEDVIELDDIYAVIESGMTQVYAILGQALKSTL